MLKNLGVNGIPKNRHLAQVIVGVGLYNFRRKMVYKGEWYGCEVLLADRFFPSTKRCSQCGEVQPVIQLDERTYQCECCGSALARDLKAALNLKQLIYQI